MESALPTTETCGNAASNLDNSRRARRSSSTTMALSNRFLLPFCGGEGYSYRYSHPAVYFADSKPAIRVIQRLQALPEIGKSQAETIGRIRRRPMSAVLNYQVQVVFTHPTSNHQPQRHIACSHTMLYRVFYQRLQQK